MYRGKSLTRILLIALALAFTSSGSAESAPVSFSMATSDFDGDFILDEILVTAQRKEENLQDVPVSLAAFSSDNLQNANITNFSDLNRLSAGLSVVSIGDGLGSTVRMRGVGQEAFGLTLQPSVAIIIDGVAQPRLDTAFASFLDVKQIEVLRGPQGTLWGRNAPAGAITIKTEDANTVDFFTSLEAIAGTLGTARETALINLPLVEDTLALRITGFKDEQEYAIRYVNHNFEESKSERSGGRVKLRFTPSDDLDVQLSYERSDINASLARVRSTYGSNITTQAATIGKALETPDPFAGLSYVDQKPDFESRTENTLLHANWSISEYSSLKWVSGYQEFRNHLVSEADTSPLDLFNVTYADNFDNNFSHELQFTFSNDSLEFLLGGYYAEVHQRNPTQLTAGSDALAINNAAVIAFPGGPGGFGAAFAALGAGTVNATTNNARGLLATVLVPDIVLENQYDTYIRALFSHATIQPTDWFSIDTGLRYSSEKVASKNVAMTTFNIPVLGAPIPGAAAIDFQDSETFDSVSGNLNFSFEIAPEVTLYLGADYGYKAGGFNGAAAPSVSSDPTTREFDEETTINYELGWKGQYFDQRLRSNGAVFYQTYDDYQVQLPDATTGTNLISNADVVSHGVEADIAFLPLRSLTIATAVSYVDAYYDDYTNAACTTEQKAAASALPLGNFIVCTQDLTDTSLNLNSRWTANVNVLYEGDSFNFMDIPTSWYAYTEAVFRDEFIGDPSGNQNTKTSSYTIYNAKLGLSSDNWEAEAWIKNLTDQEYFISLEEAAFYDGTVGIQGPRRSFGARLKYKLP